MDIGVILAGLIVGAVIGATSVGSGVIMAPILLALGVPPRLVVGSGLAYSLITKIVGAIQHGRQKTVHPPWVGLLALGSVPGAVLSTWILRAMAHHWGVMAVDVFIKKALGLVLVLSAIVLMGREFFSEKLRRKNVARWHVEATRHRWVIIVFGLIIGLIVGVTSVGSGSLVALFLLAFSRLEGRQIVGTNLVHSALVSLVAALGHSTMGNIDPRLVGYLLVGSLPGVVMGSLLTTILPSRSLRMGTAVFVLLGGLRIVTQ
jgi:hypothetical protein